jgi:hypothetical protein
MRDGGQERNKPHNYLNRQTGNKVMQDNLDIGKAASRVDYF